jgi:hypothetical protein
MKTIILQVDALQIEEVARRVFEEMSARSPAGDENQETKDLKQKLLLISNKEFITITEAAFLLSCSRSHIDNLLERARSEKTDCPIPFHDLDGLIVFKREELLAWSKQTKPKKRKNSGLRDVSGTSA